MTVTSKFKSTPSSLTVDNLSNPTTTMTITVILTGDGSDNPVPGTDKYLFSVSSGNIAPVSGSSFTSDIIATGAPNEFSASVTVVGKSYGSCLVSGHKSDSLIWKASAFSLTVYPEREIAVITKNFDPALEINSTVGTPDTLGSTATSMVVQVRDEKGNVVPESPVTFRVANVRTVPADQTGAFYATNKSPVTLNIENPKLPTSDGTTTQITDNNGNATLYVGTNANPGYISVRIETRSDDYPGGFIYIYQDKTGTEKPSPQAYIGPDISTYPKPDFPVKITNTNIQDGEFIGLFLNGKYQNQIPASSFSEDGSAKTTANVSDLLPGAPANAVYNRLIAHRTSSGDLVRSKTYNLPINSQLPNPVPKNQILGPMVNPNGGVINLGSIYTTQGVQRDYTTTINVLNDVNTLLAKMQYTSVVGDVIRIHATFQGDYKADDNYQKNAFSYPHTLSASDLSSNAVNIIIPFDDISGYGTPKQTYLINKYVMYYEYIPYQTNTAIASSEIVQGVLSTRAI